MAEESRSTSADMVVMGRVVGAYGVKGWVKILPYTEATENLCDYERWWIQRAGAWKEWQVVGVALHGNTVVAQLDGIDDREAAALLKGSDLAVPREALPPVEEDEHYWADLIGLDVVNKQGEVLGRVAGHVYNGAHDVMRVERDGAERLIPYVGAVVQEVDVPGRRIVVDWGVDW